MDVKFKRSENLCALAALWDVSNDTQKNMTTKKTS